MAKVEQWMRDAAKEIVGGIVDLRCSSSEEFIVNTIASRAPEAATQPQSGIDHIPLKSVPLPGVMAVVTNEP